MASERPVSGSTDPMTFFHDMDALRTDAPALAEPMERTLARLIDFGIAFVLYIGISTVVFNLIASEPPADAPPGPDGVVVVPRNVAESWMAGGIGLFVALGVLAVTEIATGRSPGKRLMKLRVVQEAGFERPRVPAGLLRFLVLSMPPAVLFAGWNAAPLSPSGSLAAFGMLAVVALIAGRIFFDNDRQGWHDRIAKTRVVVQRHDR